VQEYEGRASELHAELAAAHADLEKHARRAAAGEAPVGEERAPEAQVVSELRAEAALAAAEAAQLEESIASLREAVARPAEP
jgi:hypothetical protein